MLPDGYWKDKPRVPKINVLYINFLDMEGNHRRTHIVLPPSGFNDGDVIDLVPLQQKLEGNIIVS